MDKVVVMAPMRVIFRDFVLGPLFVTLFWSLVAIAMMAIYVYGKGEVVVLPED
jgi:hypothetical protein